MKHPDKEQFLKDIKDHQLTIEKEDGIHRCLILQKPNTRNMYYRIITYPGGLLITGDMGSYAFERVPDMFDFFRSDTRWCKDKLYINPGYWAEKVVTQSMYGNGIKEFDADLFKKNVKEYVDSCFDGGDPEIKAKAMKDVKDQILDVEDNEWLLVAAINNFDSEYIEFYDFWECSHTSFTYHYIWCCYAIVHAVNEYDRLKEEQCMQKQ